MPSLPAGATLFAAALVIAACGSAPSSPPRSPGSAALGRDWRLASSGVEAPSGDSRSVDASAQVGEPGSSLPNQTVMSDVTRVAAGYIAIGYVGPSWRGLAWTSPDGEAWAVHPVGAAAFTFPAGLAVGSDGTIVGVGRSGPRPVAWTSRDGAAWTDHVVPVLGTDGVAERMTTVTTGPDGFLAGGSVGPETLGRHARFWQSPDGAAWTPVPDDAVAFADAEVQAIVGVGSGFVAIGVLGEPGTPTGSVAWTSPNGAQWTRVDDAALHEGRAASLVVGPTGNLVAVGADLEGTEASVWTSADGRTWTRAPGEDARRYPGDRIQMNDVAVAGGVLVSVGVNLDAMFGSMIAWSSTDGITWVKAPKAPMFVGSTPSAIAAGPVRQPDGSEAPGVVAVGISGDVEDAIATVWLSPGR